MQAEKRKSEDDCNGDKKMRIEDEGHIYKLKGYHADRKGEREEMQDSHTILDEFECDLVNSSPSEMNKANDVGTKSETMLDRCVQENGRTIFESSGQSVCGQCAAGVTVPFPRKPVWKDGTTVTALFVINNAVYVTNLGDSRAILCRYKTDEHKEIPIVLTKDHNPTIFEERMRVQKAGGSVKDGRIMGVLEVSRSIGDGQYKNYGVTCVPDIKKCALTENDRYILIGCDGLWKAFDNKQSLVIEHIAELRRQIWSDEKLLATDEKSISDLRWETLCNRLAADAVRKGSGDNVTVLLIVIGDSCDNAKMINT